MTFIINNWTEHFEIAESRRHKKNKWLPLPNKMDGLGYKRLTLHPRKHEIFSAWILLIQLASKMPERGILENELGPLDFDDMELLTGFPAKTFKIAIEFLESPKIQWIRHTGHAQQIAGHATTTVHNITLQDITKQDSIVEQVLDCLNSICQTSYKSSTKKTVSLIEARISEKFTFEDFKKVISKKHKEWINTDMVKYLRPETLFGSKFEGYLNQKEETNSQDQTNSRIMI